MNLKITHQTEYELVVFSSATYSRLFGAVALAVSGFILLLAIGLSLAALGIPVMTKPTGSPTDQMGGIAFLIVTGLFFGLAGVAILRRAQDTTFHFQGWQHVLVVKKPKGSRTIPFEHIERAQLQTESDEGTYVYGLCLLLNNPPERLQMTDFLTQELQAKERLAEEINQYLLRVRGQAH